MNVWLIKLNQTFGFQLVRLIKIRMLETIEKQWRIQVWAPSPAYQTWRFFETEILTSKGSYITFKLADFLVKRALHFATKLNVRDIIYLL